MKQNETARYYIHRAEKIFLTVLISDVGGGPFYLVLSFL